MDTSYEADDRPGLRQRVTQKVRGSISGRLRLQPYKSDSVIRRIVLTADTKDFDLDTFTHFQEEGFQIGFLAYDGDAKKFDNELQHLADPMEAGEKYALVAYGESAALCLEACTKPMPKLSAMIAYYPTSVPSSNEIFPPALQVQIHLAGSQKFGTRHPSFRYPGTDPGFAEREMDEYDEIGASLAWSRTLRVLHDAFNMRNVLEEFMDIGLKFISEVQDADEVDEMISNMYAEPYAIHAPSLTGGIGIEDLRRFYTKFWTPTIPPDIKVKLLGRTIGTDRAVDEILCTFRHTCEVPAILPGVPPTDKRIEVVLISTVCVRGNQIYSQRIHWDQASVLVQVGLLDPKYIPPTFTTAEKGRERDIKQLPVHGVEEARQLVDRFDGKMNALVPGW